MTPGRVAVPSDCRCAELMPRLGCQTRAWNSTGTWVNSYDAWASPATSCPER